MRRLGNRRLDRSDNVARRDTELVDQLCWFATMRNFATASFVARMFSSASAGENGITDSSVCVVILNRDHDSAASARAGNQFLAINRVNAE